MPVMSPCPGEASSSGDPLLIISSLLWPWAGDPVIRPGSCGCVAGARNGGNTTKVGQEGPSTVGGRL